MLPVFDPVIGRNIQIVRRSKEPGFALEMLQVFYMIVDHMITTDQPLVATEGNLFPGKKGKVVAQPFHFIF